MTSLWRIFSLEALALWRGRTVALLLAATVGWIFVLPHVVVGDGTEEGMRELFIRYGLGGVFALLVVALLATATGAISSERESKRLQLTQVRPVSGLAIVWGRFLALSVLGLLTLSVSALLVLIAAGPMSPCSHVFRPRMESPQAEAERMYAAYMSDPETPLAVKRTKKSIVLRLLAQRAKDNYQTVATNETAVWDFPGLGRWAAENPSVVPSVRFRFSNAFDLHDDVRGEISAGPFVGAVSNVTQTAVTIPLRRDAVGGSADALTFANRGCNAVMLRPRQDVELLVPADAFFWNLLRAVVVMASVLSLVIAFGLFLGSCLSRPVALFSAFVVLIVSEMSPSVIEQYPDQLETDRLDRIGLAVTRVVEKGTRSVSSLSPLSPLADGDCVETRDALSVFALDFVLLPLLLSFLSSVLLRRKESE